MHRFNLLVPRYVVALVPQIPEEKVAAATLAFLEIDEEEEHREETTPADRR